MARGHLVMPNTRERSEEKGKFPSASREPFVLSSSVALATQANSSAKSTVSSCHFILHSEYKTLMHASILKTDAER